MTDTAATTTDAAAANGASPEKTEHKPPTRLVLVRHGVTAHTGPLLSGRMPGIDLSDKGVEQARAAAARATGLSARRRVHRGKAALRSAIAVS